MRAEKLVLSAAAAADLIAQGLSDDEVNILSNFFSALGSNLALIAAVRASQEDDTSQTATNESSNTDHTNAGTAKQDNTPNNNNLIDNTAKQNLNKKQ